MDQSQGSIVQIYYIAMVTNVLVRFVWVIYIDPSHGLDYRTRNATAAFLEMLRRVQWNFCKSLRWNSSYLCGTDKTRSPCGERTPR